jgi:hypothetical protein
MAPTVSPGTPARCHSVPLATQNKSMRSRTPNAVVSGVGGLTIRWCLSCVNPVPNNLGTRHIGRALEIARDTWTTRVSPGPSGKDGLLRGLGFRGTKKPRPLPSAAVVYRAKRRASGSIRLATRAIA